MRIKDLGTNITYLLQFSFQLLPNMEFKSSAGKNFSNFIVFKERYFFLLSHFLVIEYYELSKSTSLQLWNT